MYVILEPFHALLPTGGRDRLPGLCWYPGEQENSKEYVNAWINASQALFDNYNECVKYAELSHGPYKIFAVDLNRLVYAQPTRLQKALGEG